MKTTSVSGSLGECRHRVEAQDRVASVNRNQVDQGRVVDARRCLHPQWDLGMWKTLARTFVIFFFEQHRRICLSRLMLKWLVPLQCPNPRLLQVPSSCLMSFHLFSKGISASALIATPRQAADRNPLRKPLSTIVCTRAIASPSLSSAAPFSPIVVS